MSPTICEEAPDMLEIAAFTKVDVSAPSVGEPDRTPDITDREIANMDFSDYVFFLEEIEHR